MSKYKVLLLILLPLGLFYISLFLGRYPIDPITVLKALGAKLFLIHSTLPEQTNAVIFQLRLPRALVAMAVGAALSISGASFQGMFRNPLVSPDILGVSAAAGFGAALAILFNGNSIAIEISAFCFGIAGVALTYILSRVYRSTPVLMLVLSGVVIAAFFSALISATKYMADPTEKLPAITFWLMGSLSNANLKSLLTALPPIILGVAGLLLVRWRLNVLAMGDEEPGL